MQSRAIPLSALSATHAETDRENASIARGLKQDADTLDYLIELVGTGVDDVDFLTGRMVLTDLYGTARRFQFAHPITQYEGDPCSTSRLGSFATRC